MLVHTRVKMKRWDQRSYRNHDFFSNISRYVWRLERQPSLRSPAPWPITGSHLIPSTAISSWASHLTQSDCWILWKVLRWAYHIIRTLFWTTKLSSSIFQMKRKELRYQRLDLDIFFKFMSTHVGREGVVGSSQRHFDRNRLWPSRVHFQADKVVEQVYLPVLHPQCSLCPSYS